MERTVLIEPLQKRFSVDLKNANKAQRNRSFSQASNCCGVELKQDKKCSQCGELSPYKTARKLVKIGKSNHIIDASALDAVQELLEQNEEIRIKTFLSELSEEAQDRFDGLVYAFPVKKREAQYRELSELLKGKVAIGTAVFNSNEFQVVLTVSNEGVIKVRKLVEERQRYDYDFSPVVSLSGVALNNEILALESKIVEKHTVQDYDFSAFVDSRSEFEDKVIEDYVLNGKLPSSVSKASIQEKQDSEELERLKALAEVS